MDGNEKEFRKKYNLNNESSLFFIGTKHNYFKKLNFTKDQK